MQEGVGPLCTCERPIFWALPDAEVKLGRFERRGRAVGGQKIVLISGGSQMELTGLEPVTSWVRSRRSPN